MPKPVDWPLLISLSYPIFPFHKPASEDGVFQGSDLGQLTRETGAIACPLYALVEFGLKSQILQWNTWFSEGSREVDSKKKGE